MSIVSRLIVFILGLFSYLLHDGNINSFKNKSLTIKTIGIFVQSNDFAIQLVVVADYPVFVHLYYYMVNFCNLIGLEQWYFSLI